MQSSEIPRINEPRRQVQRSLIFPTAARYIMPLLLVFSIFLLIRGHNEVGGGFVGGLVAAAGLMLYGIANSFAAMRRILPGEPRSIVTVGLLLASLSGTIAWWEGKTFMTGLWMKDSVPVIGKLGTPLLFDLGVYLLVVGIVLWMMLTFVEE